MLQESIALVKSCTKLMFLQSLPLVLNQKVVYLLCNRLHLRGEVNKTGRPVLTGFYYFLIIPNINALINVSSTNFQIFFSTSVKTRFFETVWLLLPGNVITQHR